MDIGFVDMMAKNDDIIDNVNIHDYIKDGVDSIENDIIRGKEVAIIATKWDVTEGYVRNVSSKLRKKGIPIPKRNSRGWREISILRKEDIYI